jgi:phenylacetate-CoA ligase
VEGRQDDVLVTPSGRRIGRLDPVFKANFPLREAQIVQVAADLVLVKVVPAAGYGEHHGREIRRRMRDRLGDEMRVEVEPVEALPRGPGGKVRGVVAAWRAE